MKEYCSTDKLIYMVWLILKLMLYTTVYFEVCHLILTYVKLNIKQLLPSREVNRFVNTKVAWLYPPSALFL